MQKVKKGFFDLFKIEINPIMKEFAPRSDDWDDWLLFEGAYQEALHLIRLHIMKALKCDKKQLYSPRRINPKIEEARARKSEELFMKQYIGRRLMKVKSKLEQIVEIQEEEDPAARRRQGKLVEEIGEFLRVISPEARGDFFRTRSDEEMWQMLNS
jgi:hypothetical protein